MPIQISNIKIRAIKADSIQILPINKPINLVVKIHQAIRSLSQTKPTQIQVIPKSEHLSLRVARWHKTMLLGNQHTLSKIQVCRLSKSQIRHRQISLSSRHHRAYRMMICRFNRQSHDCSIKKSQAIICLRFFLLIF